MTQSTSRVDRPPHGWRPWLKAEWHQPVLAFAAGLALIAGLLGGWLGWILAAISLVATVVGSYKTYKRHSDVINLEAEVSDLIGDKEKLEERLFEVEKDLYNLQAMTVELLWALLTMVRDEMKMGPTERISVYAHVESLRAFQMLARSSQDPTFNRAGRTVYKDHVGVIGHTWRTPDPLIEAGLPDWEVNGGHEYVVENLRRFNLPEDECRALVMKSRSLIGVRYPDGDGGSRPMGVLVLESLDPDWASADRVNQLLGTDSWKVLRTYLHSQRDDLPLLSEATERGF